jgi:hypothetical protein
MGHGTIFPVLHLASHHADPRINFALDIGEQPLSPVGRFNPGEKKPLFT